MTILGSGRAKFELESFQGTIFLRRPQESRQSCDSDDGKDKDEKDGKTKVESGDENGDE